MLVLSTVILGNSIYSESILLLFILLTTSFLLISILLPQLYNRCIKLTIVLFPEPDAPTIPIQVPLSIFKLNFFKISTSFLVG